MKQILYFNEVFLSDFGSDQSERSICTDFQNKTFDWKLLFRLFCLTKPNSVSDRLQLYDMICYCPLTHDVLKISYQSEPINHKWSILHAALFLLYFFYMCFVQQQQIVPLKRENHVYSKTSLITATVSISNSNPDHCRFFHTAEKITTSPKSDHTTAGVPSTPVPSSK